jgi:hypothetical protein
MYRICTDSIAEQRRICNYVLVFAVQIREEGRFYACTQTWWCCVMVMTKKTEKFCVLGLQPVATQGGARGLSSPKKPEPPLSSPSQNAQSICCDKY